MGLDDHKRNILVITAAITAVILLVGANIAFILTESGATGSGEAPGSGSVVVETSPAPAAERLDPSEVCATLAPKAVAAYTSKDPGRDRLIKRYFTPDAQGLNIPADRIAVQPDVRASGGMNAGSATTATCSVWTGLESPWTLTWEWEGADGWLCTGINGPLEGAYTTLGDKAPEREDGEGR